MSALFPTITPDVAARYLRAARERRQAQSAAWRVQHEKILRLLDPALAAKHFPVGVPGLLVEAG